MSEQTPEDGLVPSVEPLGDPRPDKEVPDPDDVRRRAELLPEERSAGSAAPHDQAEAILQESVERTDAPHDPPDPAGPGARERTHDEQEHRRSADTV